MKTLSKKVLIWVLSAMLAVSVGIGVALAAISGNQMPTNLASSVADTDVDLTSGDSSVEFSIKESSIVRGGKVTLVATFNTNRANKDDLLWEAITIGIGPLAEDGNSYDTDIASKLSINVLDSSTMNFGALGNGGYDYSSTTEDRFESDGYFYLSIYSQSVPDSSNPWGNKNVKANEPLEMEFVFSVATDMPADSITFGLVKKNRQVVSYVDSGAGAADKLVDKTKPVVTLGDGQLLCNEVTLGVVNANTEANLSEIIVSEGAPIDDQTITPADEDDTNLTITLDPSNDLTTKPVINATLAEKSEGATIKIGVTDGITADVPHAPIGGLTELDPENGTPVEGLTATNNVIYIEVTPEAGGTPKIYTVTVIFTYARLEALSVKTDSVVLPGGERVEEYDKDTFEYTVTLPEDATNVTLSAKVLPDYGIDEIIGVASTGVTLTQTTLLSESNMIVAMMDNFHEDDTVTFTVKAMDRDVTQDYVLTFKIVSVDTSIKKFEAIGHSETVYQNSKEEDDTTKDFLFHLFNEDPVEAKFDIVVVAGASVTTVLKAGEETPVAYDPDTFNAEGTYTVTVKAAAGNTKEYTVVVDVREVLELVLNTTYQFLFEEEIDEEFFRVAYGERGMIHGKDDVDFERVVLGQIGIQVSPQEFLNNISEDQRDQVKIYTHQNVLVYDCGTKQPDFEEYFDDGEEIAVATGWRVEFGTDIVYLSILGDMDSDGFVDVRDAAVIYRYIRRTLDLSDKVEFRLAGYVANTGALDAVDCARIYTIIRRTKQIEDYYTYIVTP